MSEEDHSEHITEPEESVCSKIITFLCKSFFTDSELLFASYLDKMKMGEVTTSINNKWHRSTKKIQKVVQKPCHDLGTVARRNVTSMSAFYVGR